MTVRDLLLEAYDFAFQSPVDNKLEKHLKEALETLDDKTLNVEIKTEIE